MMSLRSSIFSIKIRIQSSNLKRMFFSVIEWIYLILSGYTACLSQGFGSWLLFFFNSKFDVGRSMFDVHQFRRTSAVSRLEK